MSMKIQLETQEYIDLKKELKNVTQLIKYLEGYPQAPVEHQKHIMKNIEHLKKKFHTDDLEELRIIQSDYMTRIDTISSSSQVTKPSKMVHISGWYYRPLISHFDKVQKINSLGTTTDGVTELRYRLQCFIPEPFYKKGEIDPIIDLQKYFKFKAKGKGSAASKKLEESFYSYFDLSSENPWAKTSTSADRFQVPCFHYNLKSFFSDLDAGRESVLVTGLCPLSTIADELGFATSDGKIIRPRMQFDGLEIKIKDVEAIIWPERPILSDYLALKTIFELYKSYSNSHQISVIIWYPEHEYYLELTQNIFDKYITSGLIQPGQIRDGLKDLKTKYFKLIDLVKTEFGLDRTGSDDNIRILEVDNECYNELERCKNRADVSQFKTIYGTWVGNELRRQLYENLIIKHIFPIFKGSNELHLDTSYELWVDLQAARAVENSGFDGNYSFINYPSLPSLSLKWMREYNAPFEDKLYLLENSTDFIQRLEKLSKNYILHVAPLVLNYDQISHNIEDLIIKNFKTKLVEMNNHFQ
jgi:hypothetical protein